MSHLANLDFERGRGGEDDVSLLDLLAVLGRRKRLIAITAVVATAIGAVVAFLLPPLYSAEAVILTPQQEQPSQAILAGSLVGMGGLAALGAGGAGLWRNPAELYIGILQSRTVADDLIIRFRLREVYGRKSTGETRKLLARRTAISTGRDSLIRIRVEDRDRRRAAGLANAYVDVLHQRNSSLSLTAASARRVFFEQQLSQEKNVLADAEVALKSQQQSSGLLVPQGQAETLLRSMAQLRSEITAREAQLQGMQAYAAEGNPQRQVLEREVAALRGQLSNVEGGARDGIVLPARKLPQAGLDYVRRLREVKYHELLFEILSRQYEAARLDEARQAPVVQVIDAAVVPERRSWPPRTLLTLGAGLLGTLAACAWVLLPRRRGVAQ